MIVAAVLGAGAMLAAAGCVSSKKGGEIRAEGETTIISSPTKTAAEYTPEENAYVLAGKTEKPDFLSYGGVGRGLRGIRPDQL